MDSIDPEAVFVSPEPPVLGAAPPAKPSWRALARRSAQVLVVASVLFALAAFIPTRYYLKAPGRADDLSRMVQVEGGRHDFRGKLLMTTVIYERANFFFCLYAAIDPQAELEEEEATHLRRSHFVALPLWHMNQMDQSKLMAKLAAMRYLKIPVGLKSDGVRILAFLNHSPAYPGLQPGDVIYQVDHTPVKSYVDLHEALKPHKAGDQVHVEVERAGTTLDREVPLMVQEGKTMMGVQVENAFNASELPHKVEINSRTIQGGSAGLMFTLEIIRQMEGVDIARGHVVAGTGTIDPDGTVGPVEGVPQKLVAAERAGATVFLVPQENYDDLPHQHAGIQVLPVKTVQDALKALESLP